jgi:hypothetical protein
MTLLIIITPVLWTHKQILKIRLFPALTIELAYKSTDTENKVFSYCLHRSRSIFRNGEVKKTGFEAK